jgi:hypothetical protein
MPPAEHIDQALIILKKLLERRLKPILPTLVAGQLLMRCGSARWDSESQEMKRYSQDGQPQSYSQTKIALTFVLVRALTRR